MTTLLFFYFLALVMAIAVGTRNRELPVISSVLVFILFVVLIEAVTPVPIIVSRPGRKVIKRDADYFRKKIRDIDARLVRDMIDRGIDLNIRNEYGETPLHCACSKEKTEAVKLLLEQKVRTDILEHQNLAPLHYVCMGIGHDCNCICLENKKKLFEIGELLLAAGARVNYEGEHSTCVHALSFSKDDIAMEFMKKLVVRGAELDVKDKANGVTPLGYAEMMGNTKMVDFLLECMKEQARVK